MPAAVWTLRTLSTAFYQNFMQYFTTSTSIAGNDDLNYDIVEWIEKNVIEKRNPRALVAKTATVSDHALAYFDNKKPGEEQAPSIKYVPTSERTGKEPLVVMVLGRSVTPIKRFLKMCHGAAGENRKTTIAVYLCGSDSSGEWWWLRAIRRCCEDMGLGMDQQDLAKLATEFASYIPTDMLTPAEFQGHLIIYRDSAAEAVKETKTWVTEHRRSKEEEQEWAKRASLWKAAQKGRILTPEVEDKATKNKDEP
ncbi:uncharacterized protein RAG0_13121 [Rhynchosporium agropyri]|uniref:BCS1 N-terminal domain-containing protein n=1 Tax=Rhynchosporium agropyri TaxID=914238 RepID=A0A1E1LB79_9HELO|nr:uncharacterized protein RAG0_13121 [Rhynchosporium agropyri]